MLLLLVLVLLLLLLVVLLGFVGHEGPLAMLPAHDWSCRAVMSVEKCRSALVTD